MRIVSLFKEETSSTSLRSLLTYLILLFFSLSKQASLTLGNLVYALGIFISYDQTVYFVLQSLPSLFFTGYLLLYLSIWAKLLIELQIHE